MRQIQLSSAKARFSELLDDVERGESILITRHGKAIARIVPEKSGRRKEIEEAIKAIKEIQKKTGRITVEEILSARDEGRD
jgi:prevent-host-death family protein